jgi:hypothetical protein
MDRPMLAVAWNRAYDSYPSDVQEYLLGLLQESMVNHRGQVPTRASAWTCPTMFDACTGKHHEAM